MYILSIASFKIRHLACARSLTNGRTTDLGLMRTYNVRLATNAYIYKIRKALIQEVEVPKQQVEPQHEHQ